MQNEHSKSYEERESANYNDANFNQTKSLSNKAIPGSAGMDLVLSCMEEYPDNSKVQQNALNAILSSILRSRENEANEYSDNQWSHLSLQHHKCVASVLKALDLHIYRDNTPIQWRAITILMELTTRSQENCRLVAKENGCESLLHACKRFQKDPALLQVALWTLANLCQQGTIILSFAVQNL